MTLGNISSSALLGIPYPILATMPDFVNSLHFISHTHSSQEIYRTQGYIRTNLRPAHNEPTSYPVPSHPESDQEQCQNESSQRIFLEAFEAGWQSGVVAFFFVREVQAVRSWGFGTGWGALMIVCSPVFDVFIGVVVFDTRVYKVTNSGT